MAGGRGRFGRPRGRFFSVRDEQQRIDRGMELYQTVYGAEVDWFFHLPEGEGTVVDDIYDEGLIGGGKAYDGPLRVPVLSVVPSQGQERADDQGFATYDRVVLRLSYEQARRAGLDIDLVGNRETHLHDRFVWRRRVFDVEGIQSAGHFDPGARDTVIQVSAIQLRGDEVFDSPIFQAYAL